MLDRRRAAEHAFHFQQLFFVGEADAAFEPMVDVGLGEFPFPAHLAARQLAAVCQLGHLLRRKVEVAGQSMEIKVAVWHGIRPLLAHPVTIAAATRSAVRFSARLVSSPNCMVTDQRPSRSPVTNQCGCTTVD